MGVTLIVLGVVGYITPMMPGTVFLILALYCFTQSENGPMRNWLLQHKWFGKTLTNWEENKAIPLKIKVIAISCIVVSCSASAYIARASIGAQVVVIVLGLIGVVYVLSCRTSESTASQLDHAA